MDQDQQLDDIDLAIVRNLRRNGRTPFKGIADQLGISEGTVRNRINRMTEQGVMRIVAVTDPAKLGFSLDCIIGVSVDLRSLQSVAAQVAEFEELRYVGIASGPHELIIAGTFSSQKQLLEFLTGKLASLEGVQRCETFHILQVYKSNYDYAPVLPPSPGTG